MGSLKDSTLTSAIKTICSLTKKLGRLEGTRTGTDDAKILASNLHHVRDALNVEIGLRKLGDFHLRVGAGNGYVPRVPWVFVSKDPGPVSSNVGLAICFGRDGNGLVLGKMYPLKMGAGQIKRSINRKDEKFINVDGVSTGTRYNDRFCSPSEFLIEKFDSNDFLEAIFKRLPTL